MRKLLIAILVAGFFTPVFSHAQGIEQLQAEIQAILVELQKIQAGQSAPLPSSGTLNAAPVGTTPQSLTCPNLSRNLAREARGDDVMQLQRFLVSYGVLSGDSRTGFYGPLTEKAVKEWQALRGIVSSGTPETTGYGAVGPKTRAAIIASCGVTAPSISGKKCLIVAVSPPPASSCITGSWQPTYGTDGCQNGWFCPAGYQPPPVYVPAPGE